MAIKSHALFAASSSERWVSCPSSLHRSPPNLEGSNETAASREGTLAHELMERCLVERAFPGELDPRAETYPAVMQAYVTSFVKYVWEELAKTPGGELIVEKKVYLDDLHITEAFGTVDVAIVEPFGVLHVIDFKYGFKWVSHVDNLQMIYYALGLCYEHGFDFETIKTTIFQPRVGDGKARTDSFSVEKLWRYERIFKDAISDYENGDADSHLSAGDHCHFCPAKINCPEITKTALKQAQLDFEEASQPSPESLTSNHLGAILDKATYLKLWIKEVETEAIRRLERKEVVPGYELVPTRASRKWADLSSPLPDFLYQTVPVSPAEALKILKSKGASKEKIESFERKNIVLVSGGVKLQSTTNHNDNMWPDDAIID